jgi:uncharacterized protein (DUF58 family)
MGKGMFRQLRGFFLGLLIAVVAVLFFRGGFFPYALYALLAALLLAWLTGHYALAGIEHQRFCTATRAKLGETFEVSIEIQNRKALPVPWVLMEDVTPERLPKSGQYARVAFLRGGQSLSLAYTVTCSQRGYHQVGPLILESGDLFGLVRRFRIGAEANYVLVHPRVLNIARYAIPTTRPVGEVRIQQHIFEDPTRAAGVREYRRGDPLHRIHWRATARTGVLQSRVYEPSTMIGATVALDFYIPAYEGQATLERSELAVVAAASIAHYVCEQRQQAGFLSNGRDAADRVRWEREAREFSSRRAAQETAAMLDHSDRLRPLEVELGRGDGQVQRILDALARLELSDGMPFHQMLLNEYYRLPREAALVAIVPQVTPELVEAFIQMKRSGFVITVFVVRNPSGYARAVGLLAREHLNVLHLSGEEDLYELAWLRL